MRVGRGEDSGVDRLAVHHRTRADGDPGGQVLDERAQPTSGRVPQRSSIDPRLDLQSAGVKGVGPRPNQPALAPVPDHRLEDGVPSGQVGGADIDRSAVDVPHPHSATAASAPVQDEDLDARPRPFLGRR